MNFSGNDATDAAAAASRISYASTHERMPPHVRKPLGQRRARTADGSRRHTFHEFENAYRLHTNNSTQWVLQSTSATAKPPPRGVVAQ